MDSANGVETVVRTIDQIAEVFAQNKVDMPRLPTDATVLRTFDYAPKPGCGSGGYLEFNYTS
ncbi:hypothetical protein HZB00_03525 [Candidatus Woesearchaeota archaeon]|nr:hypothetical protein [Candidatus Woesearchaeota archaeon]